jgi:outer membrane lipoprotein-sorting protein
MYHRAWAAALAAALLPAGGARADEAAGARAVVEKAVRAKGGAAAIDKYHCQTTKADGKFYGMGEAVNFTAKGWFEFPGRSRMEIDAAGFAFVQVVAGGKGWVSTGGVTHEMTKEQLAEAGEDRYANGLARLTPLLQEGFKLSPLGETKVDGKPAVGVKVEHKGHREVRLFFDKDSGLLLKMERKATDFLARDTSYTAETTFGDYRKTDGIQVAYKFAIRRDGKLYAEYENTEVKFSEKLDDKLFTRP